VRCSCGYLSKEECSAIFVTLLGEVYTDFRYGKTHRLLVDAYAMQHPERYMISAKSYAAHLMGMCIHMEYGDDPELFRLTQQWLNGKKQLERPALPKDFGDMTIGYVWEARDGAEHNRLVEEWAYDVWEAFMSDHELAREWIAMAKREAKPK
jgi:hypothetical protein